MSSLQALSKDAEDRAPACKQAQWNEANLQANQVKGTLMACSCHPGADQVHYMLMPRDSNGEMDKVGARFMRECVLKLLLLRGPRNQLTAMTGSLVLTWLSIAAIPGGSMLYDCRPVDLPAEFPADHMALLWKHLTSLQPVPPALLRQSLQRPACLTTMVEDWPSFGQHYKDEDAADCAVEWTWFTTVRQVQPHTLSLSVRTKYLHELYAQGCRMVQAVAELAFG